MITGFNQMIGGVEKEVRASHHEHDGLLEDISKSKIFQDYEKAFSEATGISVSLRPVASRQLADHDKPADRPLDAILGGKNRLRASCQPPLQKFSGNAHNEAHALNRQIGLIDTAVPVHLGEKLIGFLQTAQVLRKKLTEAQIEEVYALMMAWGVDITRERLAKAFQETKVMNARQYNSMVKLLTLFAEHISLVSNQITGRQQKTEPPAVARARVFIQEKHEEDISLGQVAKAVNVSTFHFCKIFKKATGLHFTQYVSRVRTEKAKDLLHNRNLRVSEIAYQVGFQSLTHFNRVFKRITGEAPTAYRDQLGAGKQ